MSDAYDLMINFEEDNPLLLFEYFLQKPLSNVYSVQKKVSKTDWTKHYDLLIDKYANHAGTLFHLMNGFIERKGSTLEEKRLGYDMLSINALLRVLMETYITFNHIFISPNNAEEKKFRFLLWQLDGLKEKKKFKVEMSDFDGVETILANDQAIIDQLHKEIEGTVFYNSLPVSEAIKIYNPLKHIYAWKFSISTDFKIKPLKIIELIELVFCKRSFVNLYKYTSIYTHSGYVAIQHFEKYRGKVIPPNYSNPLAQHALFMTLFLIKDICVSDDSNQAYSSLLPGEINYINLRNKTFRNI